MSFLQMVSGLWSSVFLDIERSQRRCFEDASQVRCFWHVQPRANPGHAGKIKTLCCLGSYSVSLRRAGRGDWGEKWCLSISANDCCLHVVAVYCHQGAVSQTTHLWDTLARSVLGPGRCREEYGSSKRSNRLQLQIIWIMRLQHIMPSSCNPWQHWWTLVFWLLSLPQLVRHIIMFPERLPFCFVCFCRVFLFAGVK